MDGLGRAIGAGVPIEFDGKTVVLDPVTLGDFGLIEQHLLATRPNPLDLAKRQAMELLAEASRIDATVSSQNEFMQRMYMDLAKEALAGGRAEAKRANSIPPREVAEWIDTLDGLVFTLWLKLDQRYPGTYSKEKVTAILQGMAQEQLERLKKARDQASGMDELGNSTGPTSPVTTGTAGPLTGG